MRKASCTARTPFLSVMCSFILCFCATGAKTPTSAEPPLEDCSAQNESLDIHKAAGAGGRLRRRAAASTAKVIPVALLANC
jgi:hypothetical protein